MRALALPCLLAATALAEPGGAGDAPQLSLEQAVAKAQAHAKAKAIDLSRQYLQAAEFNPGGATEKGPGRCWALRWQLPRAKGGTTFITVCESGRLDVTFGE